MVTDDKSETSTPADEVFRLHKLIEQGHTKLTPHGGAQDPARHPLALATIAQTRTTVQLPRLSAIFPAFSSGRNAGEPGYPTPGPTPAGATSSSHAGTPRPYTSPHASPESQALSTFTPGMRNGFAFHRNALALPSSHTTISNSTSSWRTLKLAWQRIGRFPRSKIARSILHA